MKIESLFLAAIVIFLTSLPGRTQEAPAGTELVGRLEQGREDCPWNIRTLTGGPKGKMLLHQRSMENVLEKFKVGEPVDPKVIDQALQGHPG